MLQPPVTITENIRGDINAPVLLVEYGDFQCPHCRLAYPHVKKTLMDFGEKVAFVSRNFPITASHPMALSTAMVAEATAGIGKYWEFIETVYKNQDMLSEGLDGLVEIAGIVGLDTAFITEALINKESLKKIEADQKSGLENGVKGTPTFFINGVKHLGSFNHTDLKIAIDAALAVK